MLMIAILVELLGIVVASTGIGLELALGGDIYLVMTTGGSVLVALGGIMFGKFFKMKKG